MIVVVFLINIDKLDFLLNRYINLRVCLSLDLAFLQLRAYACRYLSLNRSQRSLDSRLVVGAEAAMYCYCKSLLIC